VTPPSLPDGGPLPDAGASFEFMDLNNCFDPGRVCYFTNPASPYGTPVFSNPLGIATQLRENEALVLLMVTPPTMTYFGVTPYVFTKWHPGDPNDFDGGYLPVFESLGDTVNMTNVGTAGDGGAFGQVAVFVMTADQTTYTIVQHQLEAIGFPRRSINLFTIPLVNDADASFQMGNGLHADTYSLVLRVAYPQDQAAFSAYIDAGNAESQFSLMKVSPPLSQDASVMVGDASNVPRGTPEDAGLMHARDQLVNDIEARYPGYWFTELPTTPGQTRNYFCYTNNKLCNGDNSDAIYTRDTAALDGGPDGGTWVPPTQSDGGAPEDRILVVGVDHVVTGKATYISESIDDDTHQVGVAGVSDIASLFDAGATSHWLHGSAQRIVDGGQSDASADYPNLFAVMFGYDCGGDPSCYPIPTPDAGVMGVAYHSPIDITSRVYVDPQTGTRPKVGRVNDAPGAEIIANRVFLMQKKP
jgi:hypothetical protein